MWLAEIEGTPRPQIAEELGIKPNAVSALLRRARKGLQIAWLEELLPTKLRDNKHHHAKSLPKYVSGQVSQRERDEVASHLGTCSQCAQAHEELRGAWWKMGNQTLKTLGLGALGASLAAGSDVAGVGARVAGAAGATLGVGDDDVQKYAKATDNPDADTTDHSTVTEKEGADPDIAETPSPEVADPLDPPRRLSGDEWVPYLDLSSGGAPYRPLARPSPSLPESVTPPAGPEADESEELSTPQFTPPQSTEFIAHVIAGTASPGAVVNIEVRPLAGTHGSPEVHAAPADGEGVWAFDLAALDLEETEYQLQVWQTEEAKASAVLAATFRLHAVGVTLLDSLSVPTIDAELDGFPVDFNGPSSGTVCLVTDTDQRFDVPLGESGRARRFIRLLGSGDFKLRFMNCEGDRYGPSYTSTIEVVADGMPGFGAFGLEIERRVLVDEA